MKDDRLPLGFKTSHKLCSQIFNAGRDKGNLLKNTRWKLIGDKRQLQVVDGSIDRVIIEDEGDDLHRAATLGQRSVLTS
jgi:hypothetical protein